MSLDQEVRAYFGRRTLHPSSRPGGLAGWLSSIERRAAGKRFGLKLLDWIQERLDRVD